MAKPKIIPNLAGVEDVDRVLAEIAEAKAEIAIVEAEFHREVNKLRDKLIKKAGARYLQIVKAEKDLHEWAEAQKPSLFAKTRSILLAFGEIGFRKSPESIEVKNEAETVKRLKEMKIKGAVEVKESVKKSVLKSLSDEVLKKIGAKRVQEDVFFYKVKEEKFQ